MAINIMKEDSDGVEQYGFPNEDEVISYLEDTLSHFEDHGKNGNDYWDMTGRFTGRLASTLVDIYQPDEEGDAGITCTDPDGDGMTEELSEFVSSKDMNTLIAIARKLGNIVIFPSDGSLVMSSKNDYKEPTKL